jgi:hypothetical protein
MSDAPLNNYMRSRHDDKLKVMPQQPHSLMIEKEKVDSLKLRLLIRARGARALGFNDRVLEHAYAFDFDFDNIPWA